MFASLDELTYDHEEDGTLLRRQLEKVVLATGAWATVMFVYQDLDRKTGSFGPARIAVVRFRKVRGAYRKHAAFAIADQTHARHIAAVVERWYPQMAASDDDDVERPDGEAGATEASYEDHA